MCGIGGIVSNEEGAYPIVYPGYRILFKLQNRGEDAAGFGTVDNNGLEHIVKDEDVVEDVFTEEELKKLQGPVGVFATRYRTMGGLGKNNVQPFSANSRDDRFTCVVGQNGNITNHAQLRGQLEQRGFYFQSENDTEVIAKTLAYHLGKSKETNPVDAITAACTKTIDSMVGGYIVVAAVYDRATKDHYLVSFTDPRKIRPGVVGKKDGMIAIVSESNALEQRGFQNVKDLLPGEVFIARRSDMSTYSKVVRQKMRTHCFFEWVYMADPNSVIEGLEVNDARFQLGKRLAQENMDLQDSTDIVMPHPFTAIPTAAGFAETIGRPDRQGIIKDRNVKKKRIFLMPDQQTRLKAAEEAIEVVISVVYGRNVTVVDDSVVKMDQSPVLLRKLAKAGAKSANLAISCPPIIDTCYKGIYFPELYELGAYNKERIKELMERGMTLSRDDIMTYKRSIAEIQARLQEEVSIPVTLRYLSLEGLLAVLTDGDKKHIVPRVQDGHFDSSVLTRERSPQDFCLACITHKDPIANDKGGLVE